MRRQATKTKQPAESQTEQEKAPLTLVGFPAPPLTPCLDQAEKTINKITVDYESAGYAEFERGSPLRVFRKEFRRYVGYLMSDRGGNLSLEDACKEASVRYDQKGEYSTCRSRRRSSACRDCAVRWRNFAWRG